MEEVRNYPCILKDMGATFGGGMHTTRALMARDWKGLNNRGSNGVLVKRKVKTNDSTKQVNQPKT